VEVLFFWEPGWIVPIGPAAIYVGINGTAPVLSTSLVVAKLSPAIVDGCCYQLRRDREEEEIRIIQGVLQYVRFSSFSISKPTAWTWTFPE
jgi:hypothetical protein